ncbi:MAG: hypothetical protein MUC49_14760 [Raineya sp.]|jgi:hypothetical protein|nr:hypothetical protein [Raineya sp.]
MEKETRILGMSSTTFVIVLIVVLAIAFIGTNLKKLTEALKKNTDNTKKAKPSGGGSGGSKAGSGSGGGGNNYFQNPNGLSFTEVKTLQKWLNSKGEKLVEDGALGPLTTAALQRQTGKASITSQEIANLVSNATVTSANTNTNANTYYGNVNDSRLQFLKKRNAFFQSVAFSEVLQNAPIHNNPFTTSQVTRTATIGEKIIPTGYTIDVSQGDPKTRYVEIQGGGWILSSFLKSTKKTLSGIQLPKENQIVLV